jgi:thiol-disulfide isomerase/thioredoxin
VGKKVNCSAVLSSRLSKIGGGLSWSEAGFVYFSGGFLLLTISGAAALPFIYWLNIFSLPYIIFSLGYQAFKIRQWCLLCLIVQFLLLSEFLSAVFAYPAIPFPAPEFTADSLILLFLSFFLPAFAWFFARPFIYGAKAKSDLQYQLARFKNSTDIFNAMLSNQPAIDGDTTGLGITIGDPHAKNTLIKVCNPYCGPCAKAHPKIDDLITHNPNWKVQIIFSAKVNEDELKFITVSHLMAIAEKSEKENQEWLKAQALHDWYSLSPSNTDKYRDFAIKYPLNGEIKQQEAKVQAMYEWCKKNAVMFTPTFFVNGHRLPEQYEVTDLQHL